MQEVPARMKTAAIIQLVSGALNIFVMPLVVGMVIGTCMGVLTIFLGGIGACCGAVGWILVPIGIFEVVSGIMGLTNPQSAGGIMKIAAIVELVSILFGGLLSAIAGGFTMMSLNDPEVAGYIEGARHFEG